jgi:hypothetical protein
MTSNKQQVKCPICNGTGFANGEICPHITGKKPEDLPKVGDLPEGWDKLFGFVFGGKKEDK